MEEKFMQRCIELALKGMGSVAPNPMVGCVIVHQGKIIGEGYHRVFGEAHAEVNAISSVKDESLLRESTLYVSLEPCSHFGKTPPCSNLVLEKGIPRVVVGTRDPSPVSSGGSDQLKEKGLEVIEGVLDKECLELNKRWFTFQQRQRPWILLKWAQTADGFLDRDRKPGEQGVNWITSPESRRMVHKWRSEESAILVGTTTALLDDPELTVRDWTGKNPLRLVIDKEGNLPSSLNLFNNAAETWIFSSAGFTGRELPGNVKHIPVENGKDYLEAILEKLFQANILSLMVEGGAALLNSFLEAGLWDEARVFTGPTEFGTGLKAPSISFSPDKQDDIGSDRLEVYRNA